MLTVRTSWRARLEAVARITEDGGRAPANESRLRSGVFAWLTSRVVLALRAIGLGSVGMAAMVALLALPGVAGAGINEFPASSEIAVKATFVYNFAKFSDWHLLPPAAPITLCVVGDARMAGALVEIVRGQSVSGHPIDVRAMGADAPMVACGVVFISSSETRRATVALDGLKALPILTVGDSEGFARLNGTVELFTEGGRMRFAINTDAVDRSGVRLSSRLLGLARLVRDDHVQ